MGGDGSLFAHFLLDMIRCRVRLTNRSCSIEPPSEPFRFRFLNPLLRFHFHRLRSHELRSRDSHPYCIADFICFFSGSEAALLSLPHEKAKQIADEHGLDSRAIQHWLNKPNDILTTILVGNNFVNILIASLSTSIAQRFLAMMLSQFQ